MPVRGDNTYKTYRTPAQIRNSTTVKARATSLNSAIFFYKQTIATPDLVVFRCSDVMFLCRY